VKAANGRRDWPSILAHAAAIVASYDTGVTLRQLFYRLVSNGTLRNTQADYGQLSSRTAAARRAGGFPALVDRTRAIHRLNAWDGPAAALATIARVYRRDRTEGQAFNVILGIEKDGLTTLLQAWFGDYGVPVVVTRGYPSQTYVDDIAELIEGDGRPAVLLYGGDFDPSGEDIRRDFAARVGVFDDVRHVALTPDQVDQHQLPPMLGKATDSRAAGFTARHGQLVQVEIDALPPDVLRELYAAELDAFFDKSTWRSVVEREKAERAELGRLAGRA